MYLENLIDIYDSESRKLDMEAMGLLGLKLQIPSPSYKTNTLEVDGRGGSMVMDRLLQPRELSAEFITMADDYKDSLRLRDNLYRLLGNGKLFFVAESKNPNKRWPVYFEDWTPDRKDVKVTTFDVQFICENGFSESINRIRKVYTTPTFRFNNEGDISIDPRIHSEVEIKFSGASNNLIIRNTTTGEQWSWTGTTIATDNIILSGIRSLKNGASIFGQTNKKLLTMSPGWNSFEVVGASGSYTLTITTRFYFL